MATAKYWNVANVSNIFHPIISTLLQFASIMCDISVIRIIAASKADNISKFYKPIL